jgi:hypothetical protein
MLNRTNRTLSATLARLNLGTRSLALAANVNNGAQTLRTRHAHRVVMRDGMLGYQPSIPIMGGAIPQIPSSPTVPSWLPVSPSVWPGASVVAVPSASADRPCRVVVSRDPSLKRDRKSPVDAKRERKSFTSERFRERSVFGRAAARASQGTQAALHAALGG